MGKIFFIIFALLVFVLLSIVFGVVFFNKSGFLQLSSLIPLLFMLVAGAWIIISNLKNK